MRKAFLLLIKYMPIIQMIGFMINSFFYITGDYYELSYQLDFIIGNSLLQTVLLMLASYVFNFCVWHRIIIMANFVVIIISNIDAAIGIPVSDMTVLLIYYTIYCIAIILATYTHVKFKVKDNKSIVGRSN